MNYFIQLPLDLEITEQEFIKLWNQDENYTSLAVARKTEKNENQYVVITTGVILVTLGAVGVNIVSSAIYDGIKELIKKYKNRDVKIKGKENEDKSTTVDVNTTDKVD